MDIATKITPTVSRQLWLELEPSSSSAPARLIFFLHGAASSPEEFAPVAIAWQLKFPGARSFLMQAPIVGPKGQFSWYDPSFSAARRIDQVNTQAKALKGQIEELQKLHQLPAVQTMLVAYDQGTSVALELLRLCQPEAMFRIAVLYAARLLRPFGQEDRFNVSLHLVHGQSDPSTPLVYARQCFDALTARSAFASLDLIEDAGHSINQDGIILGTTRAMQSIFKGKAAAKRGLIH